LVIALAPFSALLAHVAIALTCFSTPLARLAIALTPISNATERRSKAMERCSTRPARFFSHVTAIKTGVPRS
jgi:hypothetical protein